MRVGKSKRQITLQFNGSVKKLPQLWHMGDHRVLPAVWRLLGLEAVRWGGGNHRTPQCCWVHHFVSWRSQGRKSNAIVLSPGTEIIASFLQDVQGGARARVRA